MGKVTDLTNHRRNSADVELTRLYREYEATKMKLSTLRKTIRRRERALLGSREAAQRECMRAARNLDW